MAGFYSQWDVKGGRVVARRPTREPPPPDLDDLALFMWFWERGYRDGWRAYLERVDAAAAKGRRRRGQHLAPGGQ